MENAGISAWYDKINSGAQSGPRDAKRIARWSRGEKMIRAERKFSGSGYLGC